MTSQRGEGEGREEIYDTSYSGRGWGGVSDGKEGATEWHTGVIPVVIIKLNPRNSIRQRHNPWIADHLLETCPLRI